MNIFAVVAPSSLLDGCLSLLPPFQFPSWNAHPLLSSTFQVVIVNFYADWCRFCQMLKPIFAQAASKVGDHPRVRAATVRIFHIRPLCLLKIALATFS